MTRQIDWKKLAEDALELVKLQSARYDKIALVNTQKVLKAFRKHRVADYYLQPTTGYAYGDAGREQLDLIYADIFHTEAALVRSQFVSGTHALAAALLGNVRPGGEIVAATGAPYDTMQTIIGLPNPIPGSARDMGVNYIEVPMRGAGVNINDVLSALTPRTTLVHIQRSCGYSSERQTLSVEQIGELISAVRRVRPDIICFVDNCYGEFLEAIEPTDVGADIVAGSLIKNLGGGLAPTGGYVAGRKELVHNAACRLTAPGLAGEMGATLGDTAREFYQGLFMAPHVAMQAVKCSLFGAALFAALGYRVKPLPTEERYDIIQAITLDKAESLEKFCAAIQANSPVNAHVTPVPDNIPGYQDKIIMAAGTFVQGASIELSADGPMRAPYNVYMQGGLTFEHGYTALLAAAQMVGPHA